MLRPVCGRTACNKIPTRKRAKATGCARPLRGNGSTDAPGACAAFWGWRRSCWHRPWSSAACMSSRSGTVPSTDSMPPSSSCWTPRSRPPVARSTTPTASRWLPPAWCGTSGLTPATAASCTPPAPTTIKRRCAHLTRPCAPRSARASPCGCSPATARVWTRWTLPQRNTPSNTRPCTMHCPKLIPPMWCWPPR